MRIMMIVFSLNLLYPPASHEHKEFVLINVSRYLDLYFKVIIFVGNSFVMCHGVSALLA